MVDTPRRCPAITKGGEPCRITPAAGFTYCVWHDPQRQQEAAEKRRLGGYNHSRDARAKRLLASGLDSLGDYGSLMGDCILKTLNGKLDPGILSAVSTAVRVVKDLSIMTEYGEEIVSLREEVARQRVEIQHLRAERAS
jgi:hypothetical protein